MNGRRSAIRISTIPKVQTMVAPVGRSSSSERNTPSALTSVPIVQPIARRGPTCSEEAFRRGNQPAERESGVVNPVFALGQILHHQGTVDPGQHVVVQRIHLPECRPHLSRAQLQIARKRREGDVAFLRLDPLFAEGQEEVSARVRIDHFLEPHFALVHFERGRGTVGRVADSSHKVADHRNIGVQRFGRGSPRAAERWTAPLPRCIGIPSSHVAQHYKRRPEAIPGFVPQARGRTECLQRAGKLGLTYLARERRTRQTNKKARRNGPLLVVRIGRSPKRD